MSWSLPQTRAVIYWIDDILLFFIIPGGVLSANLLGATLRWLTPCRPREGFIVALVLCAPGFPGGLVMSAIRRERHIKEWGTLIEGHGGILDRIDSLCFTTPLYFHIMHYCFGGR